MASDPAPLPAGAKARARRGRSPWNLLLPPLTLAGAAVAWWCLARGVHALHARANPGLRFPQVLSGLSGVLMFVPLVFPALPAGMLAANAILHLVPAARRALDREAEGHLRADYATAQRDLAKVAGVALVIALAIALVGALLPS